MLKLSMRVFANLFRSIVLVLVATAAVAVSAQATPTTVSSVAPIVGSSSGNELITITGTSFVATPTVTIGGTAATSVTFISSTSLTCVTPAHAVGVVSIVVTNPDTTTGTLSNGFTFRASTPVCVINDTVFNPDNSVAVAQLFRVGQILLNGNSIAQGPYYYITDNNGVIWGAVPSGTVPCPGTIASNGNCYVQGAVEGIIIQQGATAHIYSTIPPWNVNAPLGNIITVPATPTAVLSSLGTVASVPPTGLTIENGGTPLPTLIGTVNFSTGLTATQTSAGVAQITATLPFPTLTTIGGVEAINPVAHQWLNSISTSGVPNATQPASTDLSDFSNIAETNKANTFSAFLQTFEAGADFDLVDPTDTTKTLQFSVSNIATATTRTVTAPNANTTLPQPIGAVSHQWLASLNSTTGAFGQTQPDVSDLSDNGLFGGNFNIGLNAFLETFTNAGTTGTTANTLTKLTGAGTAVKAATTDAGGVVGVTVSGAGTTGSANVAIGGQVSCAFDGSTTQDDYVQISATTAGDCHDVGSTYPTSGQVIGRVLSTNSGGGTYTLLLFGAEIQGYTSGGGGGGLTSVAVTFPSSIFNETGSPLTSNGTITATLANQSANMFFAGPTSGSPATPTLRAIVGADLPAPSASTLGGIESITSTSHEWIDSISTAGVPHQSQPNYSDLAGTLPNPGASTLGGIESIASVSHKWINTISTSGVPSLTQPASSDLSDVANVALLNANNTFSGNNTFSAALGGNLNIGSFAEVQQIANASSTGTTVNKLAKLTGAPSTLVIASTSDTSGEIGIVVSGAGTTGNAQVAIDGQCSCVFDNATTAGDYVSISSSTAGDCHDAGSTYPTSGQVIGQVLSTNGSAGTYSLLVYGPDFIAGGSGGSGTITSGTANQIPVYTASTTIAGSSNITIDSSDNLYLGIAGTNGESAEIVGGTTVFSRTNSTATQSSGITIPANVIVLAITVRSLTNQTGSGTNPFNIVGATSSHQFNTVTSMLSTAGTTDPGNKACPFLETASDAINVVYTAGTPTGTGTIRITWYGIKSNPPTS
jgi:hypothetical protein